MIEDEPHFCSPQAIVLDALRGELRRLMFYCTEAQNERLRQIYPFGIDGMGEADLKNAIGLAQRTILKNREKAHDGTH